MSGACGECSACCKVIGVAEISKPPNKWCQHCNLDRTKGCTIYETRPQDCRSFNCIWLETQGRSDALPLNHRPDQCGVVFSTVKDGSMVAANVDPGYPAAWRAPVMQRFIAEICRHLPVVVVIGKRQILVEKKPPARRPAVLR